MRKGWQTGRLHWPGRGHKHEASEADLLAPLEETEAFKDSAQCDSDREAKDTIRVDNTSVPMPEQLNEDEREGGSIFHLEPVVIFILAGMIAFIAFVAWQITLMPVK